MPLVSVIIPAHRAADYLAAAVHSVYRQSVDVECVIVLDGDGDQGATAAVADHLATERRSTRAIRQEAGGVSRARTAGYRAADPTSPYVLFLDADDALIPGRLSAMVSALEGAGHGCPAAVGSAVLVGDDGQPIASEGWERLSDGWLSLPGLIEGILALPSMTLWRRSALRLLMPYPLPLVGAGGEDLRCEDALLNRRAVCLGAMRTLATPTTFYRRHPEQWSANIARRDRARGAGGMISALTAGWAWGKDLQRQNAMPIIDPLCRTRCGIDESVVGPVVVTCASTGWERHLDAMLSSLARTIPDPAHPQWTPVVFVLGDAPEVERVARSHGAAIVPAEPLAPLGPWSKSVLYAAARALPSATSFVAIDADCIVHRAPWTFEDENGDAAARIWMVRDGNGIHPPRSGHGENLWRYAAGFAGLSDDFCRALGLHGAAGRALPANDGVFAATPGGLQQAEDRARELFLASWPHLEIGGRWWNQILWNAACAPHLMEMPAHLNVQRHAFVATGQPVPENIGIEHFTAQTKPLMLGDPMRVDGGTGCPPVAGFAGLPKA